jgi:hypothetical protein
VTRNLIRPCDLCGERMLLEALFDVSDVCGRERLVCELCEREVMDDVRAEEARADFDARQTEYWRA